MAYRLFVGDLPVDCSDERLLKIFVEKFNSVRQVQIVRNDDGISRGFGFVKFENEMDLKAALNQDIRVDNIRLRTDIAHAERRFKTRLNSYNSHPHNINHHNYHYSNSHRGTSSAPNNHTFINSKANLPVGHYHHKANNNFSPPGSSAPSISSTAVPPVTSSAPPITKVINTTSTVATTISDKVNNNVNTTSNQSQQRQQQTQQPAQENAHILSEGQALINNQPTSATITKNHASYDYEQTEGAHNGRHGLSSDTQPQRSHLGPNVKSLRGGNQTSNSNNSNNNIHQAVPNHATSSLQFGQGDPYSNSQAQQNHNHNHVVSHNTGMSKLSRPPSHINQPTMAFVDSYGMFYDASGMPMNMAPFNPAVSMSGVPISNHGDGQMDQAAAMMPPPNVYYPYGPPPQAFGYPPPNAMLPHPVPQAVQQQQHGPPNPSRYNPNQQAGSDMNGAGAGAQQPQPHQQPLYYMNYWNGQPFYYDQANPPGAPASIYHPTIHPFFVSSAAFLPNAQPPQTFNQQQLQQQQQTSEVTPNHPLPRRQQQQQQPSAPHQMPYSQGGELSNTIVKNTTASAVNVPSATTYNIESSNTNNTN